jgi:polyhydroxybutyrate depolymerase
LEGPLDTSTIQHLTRNRLPSKAWQYRAAPHRPARLGALVAVVCSLVLGSVQAAPEELSLDTKDGTRSAMLALPQNSAPEEAIPLVILLHGRGGSAQGSIGLRHSLAAPLSAWVPIGVRDKVAVLALQGTRGSNQLAGWDDCRADDPSKPEADDVSYANQVLDMVLAKHAIDRQRIYLMGMSNGAMMAFRLSQQLDLPVAAIASVAGSMPAGSLCAAPTKPVSLLMINGSADPLVPYEGGAVHFGTAEMGTLLSVGDTLALWRNLDHIDAQPKVEQLAHLPGSDGHTLATRTIWGDDPKGLQVELIRVDGGGHAEPSIDQVYGRIYLGLAGAQNHDFESAEEAWRFFKDKSSAVAASSH